VLIDPDVAVDDDPVTAVCDVVDAAAVGPVTVLGAVVEPVEAGVVVAAVCINGVVVDPDTAAGIVVEPVEVRVVAEIIENM